MNRFDKLRNQHQNAVEEFRVKTTAIANEAGRVADISKNAEKIIEDIDKQFENVTKLTKTDIVFLFVAVALQCCRQYLLTDFKERPNHDKAAEKTLLKDKVDPKNDKINNRVKNKRKTFCNKGLNLKMHIKSKEK